MRKVNNMNNLNFKTIDTASFISGMAHQKLADRMQEEGLPNLDDNVISLEFTIPVSFYDIPQPLKSDKDVDDWNFIATVVAEILEDRANVLNSNYRCVVHGVRTSSAVMFKFSFRHKEIVKKLKVEEIEKLLGYKVEIIS